MTAPDQEARAEIVEALARFAAATDSRDWPAVASMLVPDATAYGAHGVEAILERMQAHLGGCGPSQHLLGNHRIEVDGDTARSLTYARVHHVGIGPKSGSFFECLGEYDDRWALTPDGWCITRRSFDMRITLGDVGVLRPAPGASHQEGPTP